MTMKNLLSIFAFLLLGSPLLAETVLQVDGAKFRPFQVAIPEISAGAPEKATADELVKSLRADLELSGVFKVLDPKSYMANLAKEGLERSSIKWSDWTKVGAEGLVKGRLRKVGTILELEIAAHQVGSVGPSLNKHYQVQPGQSMRLTHKVADDVYQYFTGEAGLFSSQIAVTKMTSQGKQIMLLDMSGQNERQITKASSINVVPTIVPEGNAILFTSFMNQRSELFSIGVDGSGLKSISARTGINLGASVSPDRKKIALTLSKDGDSEIYTMNRDGSNPVRLTTSPGIDTSPSWSPDGKQIAFVSARSGSPQIYLMNADGSGPRRLTFQGKYNQTPKFSPKGNLIVFTGRDERNVFDIFSVDPATSKIMRVTQGQGSNEEPCLSPNGRMLVFASTRDGKRDLYLSNLDGTYQRRITQGAQYWTPSWGPIP